MVDEELTYATVFALKAVLAVLIAEAPGRKDQMLAALAEMKAGTDAPEFTKLLDVAARMVHAASGPRTDARTATTVSADT
jgi:hypothetical protein